MALKTALTFRGLAAPDAYLRVARFVSTTTVDFRAYVEIYGTEEERRASGGQAIDSVVVDFVYDPDGANLVEQAYAAVKVQLYPEARDALQEPDKVEVGQRG